MIKNCTRQNPLISRKLVTAGETWTNLTSTRAYESLTLSDLIGEKQIPTGIDPSKYLTAEQFEYTIRFLSLPEMNWELLESEDVLGFDTEWRPEFRKGGQGAAAIVQIAFPKSKQCWIVDLSFPRPPILEDPVALKNLVMNHAHSHSFCRHHDDTHSSYTTPPPTNTTNNTLLPSQQYHQQNQQQNQQNQHYQQDYPQHHQQKGGGQYNKGSGGSSKRKGSTKSTHSSVVNTPAPTPHQQPHQQNTHTYPTQYSKYHHQNQQHQQHQQQQEYHHDYQQHQQNQQHQQKGGSQQQSQQSKGGTTSKRKGKNQKAAAGASTSSQSTSTKSNVLIPPAKTQSTVDSSAGLSIVSDISDTIRFRG